MDSFTESTRAGPFVAAVRSVDALADKVVLEAPWLTEKAQWLDNQTLHSWLYANLEADHAQNIGSILTGFLPEPQDVSLLHALFYIKSNGGLASIAAIDGTAHDSVLFVGGAHRLIERLVERVGSRVCMAAPVYSVAVDDEGVTVSTSTGCTQARYCLIAMPPAMAGRLQYTPALPPARDYLTQRMPIRGKIAFVALFERPLGDGAPVPLMVTEKLVAWDEDNTETPYSISGLVSIPTSREWGVLPQETRCQHVLDELAQFVDVRAAGLHAYHDENWAAQPWVRGCNSYMATGAWTAWGHALRPSIGPLHFIGAEYSPEFYGQMDGAVRTAEETVNHLNQLLRS